MKRLLANPNKEIKPRIKRTIVNETATKNLVSESEILVEENSSLNGELIKKQKIEQSSVATNVETITKEDYIKILELLQTPSFINIMKKHSSKEAMIVSLKLGYIDGKYFSTSSIASFLEIDYQEVIDTVRTVLLEYKEILNQIIDCVIESETIESSIVDRNYNKVFHK